MMNVTMRNISELIPYERNQKKHDAKQVRNIANSLKRFGWVQPIVVDSKDVVIIGHGRLMAAKLLAEQESSEYQIAPVVVADDLTEDEVRELRIADNKLNESPWEIEYLKDDLQELSFDGFDMDFSMDVVDFDESSDTHDEPIEEHFEEKPPEIPKAKTGDVYKLGKHRLMCGDSTKEDDVDFLMDGEQADISFTSPPYGASSSAVLRKHYVKGQEITDRDKSFYNLHEDEISEWKNLLCKSYFNMKKHSTNQFINVQMLADNRRDLIDFVHENSVRLVDIMIWDKAKAAPQMASNVLNNVFEFVFVFGDDDCTRVLKFGDFHGTERNIFQITTGINEYAEIHRAVFPVELPMHILQLNKKANSVIDLFGGTGTSLIAAEHLGKKCYMMELDPRYVDVIIERWETMTGGKAVLVSERK